jgi:predicted translin family RNA/ssDNA-binding protein
MHIMSQEEVQKKTSKMNKAIKKIENSMKQQPPGDGSPAHGSKDDKFSEFSSMDSILFGGAEPSPDSPNVKQQKRKNVRARDNQKNKK